MARRNIDKVVKMAAIEEMRQGLPRNEIKERYGVAASTLSRWAQEAGVEGPEPPTAVLRSRPLNKASAPIRDSSSETRRKMLDNMLTLINDLVQGGGLKSHDVKNLGTAAKSISEAHQREQQLLREEQARATEEEQKSKDEEDPFITVEGGLRMRKSWVEKVDRDLEWEKERMLALEPGAFPSYGVHPERDPEWMVEAYHKMLAKKRGEGTLEEYQGEGLA